VNDQHCLLRFEHQVMLKRAAEARMTVKTQSPCTEAPAAPAVTQTAERTHHVSAVMSVLALTSGQEQMGLPRMLTMADLTLEKNLRMSFDA